MISSHDSETARASLSQGLAQGPNLFSCFTISLALYDLAGERLRHARGVRKGNTFFEGSISETCRQWTGAGLRRGRPKIAGILNTSMVSHITHFRSLAHRRSRLRMQIHIISNLPIDAFARMIIKHHFEILGVPFDTICNITPSCPWAWMHQIRTTLATAEVAMHAVT